jgi:hypothetical protein
LDYLAEMTPIAGFLLLQDITLHKEISDTIFPNTLEFLTFCLHLCVGRQAVDNAEWSDESYDGVFSAAQDVGAALLALEAVNVLKLQTAARQRFCR